MSCFTFRCPEWREIEPREWADRWAALGGLGADPNWGHLIGKQGRLSSEDFETIGRWKEGCPKPDDRRFRTGTPRGYDVWMKAKAELPGRECPEKDGAAAFLECWSEKTFDAGVRNGRRLTFRFGLSRATTLLHFISGGRYPILDSRVTEAMTRLGCPIKETIDGYLNAYCPLFSEIAVACGLSGARELKKLDNALFNYGKFDLRSFPFVHE